MILYHMHTTEQLEDKFNKGMMGLTKFLSNLFPSSFFSEHQDTIKGIIKERPAEPIAYFIRYIYKIDEYREKLREMDGQYFHDIKFEEKHARLKDNDIKRMFDMKDMWNDLDNGGRHLVQKVMKRFVTLCDDYVIVLTDRLEKKNEIETMYSDSPDEEDPPEDVISVDSISVGSHKKRKKKKKVKRKKRELEM